MSRAHRPLSTAAAPPPDARPPGEAPDCNTALPVQGVPAPPVRALDPKGSHGTTGPSGGRGSTRPAHGSPPGQCGSTGDASDAAGESHGADGGESDRLDDGQERACGEGGGPATARRAAPAAAIAGGCAPGGLGPAPAQGRSNAGREEKCRGTPRPPPAAAAGPGPSTSTGRRDDRGGAQDLRPHEREGEARGLQDHPRAGSRSCSCATSKHVTPPEDQEELVLELEAGLEARGAASEGAGRALQRRRASVVPGLAAASAPETGPAPPPAHAPPTGATGDSPEGRAESRI